MNVALSPDEIARACADAMWKEDDASKGLGMKIVEVKPGYATLTMTVQPHMVNGQRIAHGGFIFLLADSTFAFACNSHNQRAVAAQCDITFIRPGKLGDVLVRPRVKFRAAAGPGSMTSASPQRGRDRGVPRPLAHHCRHVAAERGQHGHTKIAKRETRHGHGKNEIQRKRLQR
jgi:phenylacetic acid degradation protein PaaD